VSPPDALQFKQQFLFPHRFDHAGRRNAVDSRNRSLREGLDLTEGEVCGRQRVRHGRGAARSARCQPTATTASST